MTSRSIESPSFRRFRTASQYDGFDPSFIFIFIFYFLFFTGLSSTCVPNSSAKRSQPVYVPRCFEVRERTRLFRQLGILFSLTRSLMHFFFFLRAFYIRRSFKCKKIKDGSFKIKNVRVYFFFPPMVMILRTSRV